MKMNEKWKKTVLIVGSIAGVYIVMQYIFPVVFPFLLGGLLAVWMHPAACFLERKTKIKRSVWGGVFILLLMAAGGFLLWKLLGLFLSQSGMLFEKAGLIWDGCSEILDNCCCMLERYTGIRSADSREFLILELTQIGNRLKERLSPAMLQCLVYTIKGSISFITALVLAFVFGIMVVKELENWKQLGEKYAWMPCAKRIFHRLKTAGGGYFKAQLFIMLAVTAVCVGGLFLLRNPYFAVVGIIIGLLDALPFIGTGTILIPWSVILVVQGKYGAAAGYFLLYLVTNLLREFLEPRLIGGRMGIHPALILVSVYVGIIIYGLSGFFLGPLTILVLKILWEEWGLISFKNKEKVIKNDRKS